MKLHDDTKILNVKSKHNFILISNDKSYEVNKFINLYKDKINNKNSDLIYIYTTTEFFTNSRLDKEEQLSILKKIFNIDENDLPICVYLGSLNTNMCTSYSFNEITSESIDRIFKDTIRKIKFRRILLNNNKSNNIFENIFNKNYLKYTNKRYKKLKGNDTIEYYLNEFVINRTLLDYIHRIYDEIELLYKQTKDIKINSNNYISSIKNNIDNEVDISSDLDKVLDKRDQELIKINSLISDKQNLIDKKYKEISLIETNRAKNIEINRAKNSNLFSKFKNWITEDEEDYDEWSYEIERTLIQKQNDTYNLNYKEHFENKSVTMINTCQVTENLLRTQLNLEDEDIDFSVCASGYWKALEIELNIIFIDTIRKSKGIILEIPSQGISYKKGKYEIFSGYRYDNNNKIPKMVNINRVNKGKLCSCMLGELLNISQNYSNNELDKIIYGFYLMMQKEKYNPLKNKNIDIDYEISIFMNSIVNETRSVVDRYRNKYSHTGVMTEEELFELKEILLKEDGLYYKVALLKKQVNIIR